MGLQVVVEKVAVTKPGDTEDTIVHKGALVPDWVSPFTQFVLTSTGMCKLVDDPDPALVAAANPPAPVQLPEHASVGGKAAATASAAAAKPGRGRGRKGKDGPAAAQPPAQDAAAEEWVAYAVAQRPDGVSEEDAKERAEALTLDELKAALAGAGG